MNRSILNFQRLVGTIEEGDEISKSLNIQPLVGEKVLESALKSYRSPRTFHVATHGFFLPNQDYDPNKDKTINLMDIGNAKKRSILNRFSELNLEKPMLRSGLALAGVSTWLHREKLPEEAEDGILTAEDVSAMVLSNTEVVVLSVCDTGLGDILMGEGAFVLAGAQTLVMSLWKVPDKQTKDLMVDFYKL